MKPVQYFSDEYLAQSRKASPKQIVEYLEQFRLMQQPAEKSASKTKLISMKVDEELLALFRSKCEIDGVRYQTQIKKLMTQWLSS